MKAHKNTFKRALLGSVTALAISSQAFALTIENFFVGDGLPVVSGSEGMVYFLANQIDFDDSSNPNEGEITFDVVVEFGGLPDDNLLFTVNVAGATIPSGFTGAEVVVLTGEGGETTCGSDDGNNPVFAVSPSTADSNTLNFIVSGLQNCGDESGTMEGLTVTLPIAVMEGASGVTVNASLETDGGLPLDGGPTEDETVIALVDVFELVVTEAEGELNNGPSELSIESGFTEFGPGSDALLGFVFADTVDNEGGDVFSDLSGSLVTDANVGEGAVTVVGSFLGFDDDTGARLVAIDPSGSFSACSGTEEGVFEIDGDTATLEDIEGSQFVGEDNALQICIVTGDQPLNASTYSGEASFELAGDLTGTISDEGELDEVTRDGVSVIFPWVSGINTNGTTNIFRIGNLSGDAISGISARVLTAQNPAFEINAAPVALEMTVPANGELQISSTTLVEILEDANGANFGARADIEFIIEAQPEELTFRRFLTTPGGITDLSAGTLAQDFPEPFDLR